MPAQPKPARAPRRIEPSSHRFVLDVVLREQRAVALDPLPEPLDARGIARPEVAHRAHDGPREANRVDPLARDPALLRELAPQLVAVELLDGAHELGRVDPLDVHHLGLHRPLDGGRERLHGRHRIMAVRLAVRRHGHGRAERDEHARPE